MKRSAGNLQRLRNHGRRQQQLCATLSNAIDNFISQCARCGRQTVRLARDLGRSQGEERRRVIGHDLGAQRQLPDQLGAQLAYKIRERMAPR